MNLLQGIDTNSDAAMSLSKQNYTVRTTESDFPNVRAAWAGRISGCMLGKPLEVLSFRHGREGVRSYLEAARALPLRDYVPLIEGTIVAQLERKCCRERLVRAEPDDDIDYTVLSLLLLEQRGVDFDTADVARAWLRMLPAGTTWTAERAAYRRLLGRMSDEFVNGADAGFDVAECSDNEFNEWIGARIRSDLYGWVCPGRPALAAAMAERDARLSHRGAGVHSAVFVAALGAALPASVSLDNAIDVALKYIPDDCETAAAIAFGREISTATDAVDQLHERYADYSPLHSLNNLALVIWALCSAQGDFGVAIGNVVTAGWDTDCNGATVGGLVGLGGAEIPDSWTRPWQGRIGVGLAGVSELQLNDVVARTITVARHIEESH